MKLLVNVANFKYVDTEALTQANTQFINELQEAIKDVKLIKTGKLKGRSAKDLLNEL